MAKSLLDIDYSKLMYAPVDIKLPPRDPNHTTSWSLTEPLCKPLHHFNESELEGLVLELRNSGYEERERNIEQLLHHVMEAWARQQSHSDPLYGINRASEFSFPFMAGPDRQSIGMRVLLPSWLPPEYVRPLAERQIRDQLEEG